MKKRLIVLILVFSLFIISGCQYYLSPEQTQINLQQISVEENEIEFGKGEKVIKITDKLTKNDKLSTVSLNLPTGIYEDRDANEVHIQNDDPTNTVDLTPGYIIEFEKPSLIEKKLILEKERLTEEYLLKLKKAEEKQREEKRIQKIKEKEAKEKEKQENKQETKTKVKYVKEKKSQKKKFHIYSQVAMVITGLGFNLSDCISSIFVRKEW